MIRSTISIWPWEYIPGYGRILLIQCQRNRLIHCHYLTFIKRIRERDFTHLGNTRRDDFIYIPLLEEWTRIVDFFARRIRPSNQSCCVCRVASDSK